MKVGEFLHANIRITNKKVPIEIYTNYDDSLLLETDTSDKKALEAYIDEEIKWFAIDKDGIFIWLE